MVMPSATGLFHRAIAQSVPGLYFTEALATDIAAAITGHLGLPPSARELARISPSRLNDAADEVAATMAANPRWGQAAHLQTPFAPVVDGEVLPAVPWQALAGGAASGVELIVGHTRDEYRLFMAVKGELGEITPEQTDAALRVLAPDPGAYRAAHPAVGPERLYELLHSDRLFRMPSLRLAEAHHPHGPTHLYELTWNAPGMGGETLGACHGLGLPLTFGNLTAGAAAFLIGHQPPPEAAAAGDPRARRLDGVRRDRRPRMARLRPARAAHLDHRHRTGREALPRGDLPPAVGRPSLRPVGLAAPAGELGC